MCVAVESNQTRSVGVFWFVGADLRVEPVGLLRRRGLVAFVVEEVLVPAE